MGMEQGYRSRIKNDACLTPFQKRVLLATLKIPRGKTRSYAWVAKEAGSPKASRAVGQALNKNPYAPHVPCHRVISSDGSIGGYAGGVAAKRRLLEGEGIRFSGQRAADSVQSCSVR